MTQYTDFLERQLAQDDKNILQLLSKNMKLEHTIVSLLEEMDWALPILQRYLTHPNDEAYLTSFEESIKRAKK